ncbi:MAG: hypothetical protein FWE60_00555 [Oscillospiraceae bacterium]|nr:hypothetical protein [Oscillospiraceae bacterium]
MTNKELTLLGKALQALLELKEYDKVKEIVDAMASTEVKSKLNDNKKGQD